MHRSKRVIRFFGLVALLPVTVALYGCSSSSKSSAGGSSSGTGANGGSVATPAPTTLRIGVSLIQPFIDPAKFPAESGDNLIFDRLLLMDKNKVLHPGLATSWTVSSDGRTILLNLRQGVRFHDGTTMDATSVKLSLQRMQTLPASAWASYLKSIQSIDIVNPYQVRLNLSHPDATLLQTLAKPAGSVISAKAIEANLNLNLSDQGAGSTPYQVVSFIPGQTYIVQKTNNIGTYWDSKAWPFNRVELDQIADPNALVNELKTGRVDMIQASFATESTLKQEFAGTNFNIYTIPSETVDDIMLNPDRSKFASQSVRQGIGQALNLNQLVSSGALQTSCTAVTQFFASSDPGYVSGYAPLAYNAQQAKAALANVGPFSFTLVYPTGAPQYEAVGEYMQQQLAPLGVKVTLQPATLTQVVSGFGSGQYDAATIAIGGESDPTISQNKLYVQVYKAAGPDKATVSSMITTANSYALGSSARVAPMQSLNRYTLSNAWAIPICQTDSSYVAKKSISGIPDMAWEWTGQFDARYLS